MSSMGMKKPKSIPAIKKLANLSSRLARNTRICIVGAGPSGLSAAYALANLGYQNVTVLEKKNQVGGMCESVEIEGRMYDIGGQVLTLERCPNIRELINQLNVEMEDMSNHRLALIDCSNGSCEDLKVAEAYLSLMPHTMQLQEEAEESGKLGIHALSNLASETTRDFLSRKGIHKELPKAVAASYTASGYGFLDDMPYAYVHEFGRTCMLGKVSRVKGGYAGFWQQVAASYVPNLKCNMEVINIDRTGGVIKVLARNINTDVNEKLEFDYIFLTGALPFCTSKDGTYRSPSPPQRNNHHRLLNFTPTEEVLFSRVRTIEYYTTILRISQLNLEAGFYFCKNYVEDPQKIGHPVAIQRFFPDTDIYLAWSYGNSDLDQQQITKLLFEDVESIGGQIGDVILQQKWNYFPHVSSEEMTTNFYDKLEALQGQNNTCYLGALFAFELTERNVAYSMDIVGRFFGAKKQPSLKSLMGTPLEANKVEKAYFLDELTELPGVQFPDLPHVDAYLTYYSHHDIFKNRVLYTWLDDQGKEVDRRTFAEVDERATIIADLLATKYNVGSNDCVLLLYPPGLDFIEAFMGCLRAKVLAVPLMPPEPGQAGQALTKLQNVSEKCHPKLILSTISYHSAVYLMSLKSRISPGRYAFRANTSNTTWPQLPWLHTDSLFAKSKSSYFTRVVEYFWGHASTLHLHSFGREKFLAAGLASLVLQGGKGDTHVSDAVVKESDKNSKRKINEAYTQPGRGRPFVTPTDVSFLQFTSGSTGDAKGVTITHGGLIHNVKLMRSKFKSTSRTVLVSWLPQYHDMGLIGGLLTSMVSGGTAVLFSPITFIRNPMLWLETMSKYKATHSAAPNFAFELIVRRLETLRASGIDTSYIDLRSIQFLMSSAEPIRHKSLHRFLELLKFTGLKEQNIAPGYGLAENCVFVSCAYGKGQPIILDWENRVCCGYIERGNRDADVRIVNPETFEEVPDGIEGEVWVSSLSTGAGYWGEIDLGKITFQNHIKMARPPVSDHRTFLRTGDLGRVMEGGLLFITGRIKDLIILRGRNIYPTDVEKTVETCSQDLRPGCCAAVCVPSKLLQQKGVPIAKLDDEGLVIIVEVRDHRKGDYEALALQIESAIASEHGIEGVTICFIKPRTIPKTSSGKIRRLECFHQFVNNNLQIVNPIKASQSLQNSIMRKSRELKREKIVQEGVFNEEQKTCTLPTSSFSRDHISKFLIEAVSEKTGIPKDQISVDKKIDSYGIDSIGIVWIAHRLSNFLGVHVAAIDIYAASHISELIDIVDRLGQEKNMSIISDAETHGEIGHCRTQISSEQAAETPKKPHIFVDSDVKSAAFTTTLAHRVSITALQTISILFMAFLLTSPAIFPGNGLTWLLSKTQSTYLIVLTKGLVPATFIFYVILVGLTFSLLGMTLQLTKYPLQTWIPFWSKDFVRWWTIGAHSVLMPKSTLEDGASVAALSVAPPNSILSGGDIYVGVEESLVKVRNRSLQKNSILARFPYLEKDVSIAEMDPSYLQAISQVVERFAATSICLRKRALHQTGIGAKGTMKILEGLHGLPNHDIFFPGRTFPVILRHSNAFSVHDDACPDVRGAGLRILESEGKETLLDLVLKTGQAFYVRNLVDQIDWLQQDEKGQEEIVKKFPHIGKAISDSKRVTDSFTKLHYYSNVCRLLRPSLSSKEEAQEHLTDTREFYVKFKLRPEDNRYGENFGEVKPERFSPTTGLLPRRLGDICPSTCLADDFKERLEASNGIHYVLQMQIQPIPNSFSEREVVLDCTRPWDEEAFPYRDVASIHLYELLPNEVTEALKLNHKNSTWSLDLVLAKSATDSASIDHARSLIYEMVQYLRTDIKQPSSLQ